MLVFDKRTLRCVVPPTDECEVPTTVPTPLDEEEDGRPNVPQGQHHQQQQQQGRPSSQGQARPRPPPSRPQQFQPSPQDYQQQNFQAQRGGQDFGGVAEQRSSGGGEPHINLPPGAIPLNARNRPRN